jgi:hypothetical protein
MCTRTFDNTGTDSDIKSFRINDRSDRSDTVVLTIRREQLNLFAADRRNDFETRLAVHLRRYFPDRVALLGEGEFQAFIRQGRARAARYGFDTQRDICKYLGLMCIFGRDFDSDRRLPWAAEILRKPFRTSRSKMNRLMELALAHAESA